MQENNNFGFNFDNTYIDLPKSLYSEIDLNKVPNPKFIIFNDKLAKDLGLSSSSLQSKEGLEILAKDNRTVLFVTHDIEEAIYLGDTGFVLGDRPVKIKKVFNNIKDMDKQIISEYI